MRFRVKAKHMATYKLWEPQSAPKTIKLEDGAEGGTILQEAILADVPQPEDGDMEDEDPERPGTATSGSGAGEIGSAGNPAAAAVKKVGVARVKLELRLNHGDVVVMKGREIQRIWEVCIGLLRFPTLTNGITDAQIARSPTHWPLPRCSNSEMDSSSHCSHFCLEPNRYSRRRRRSAKR